MQDIDEHIITHQKNHSKYIQHNKKKKIHKHHVNIILNDHKNIALNAKGYEDQDIVPRN